MTFEKRLNEYMHLCGCTAKELAAVSGVSQSTISRYKRGERIPTPEHQNVHLLAAGIAALGSGAEPPLAEKEVYDSLKNAIIGEDIDTVAMVENFNFLIQLLGMNVNGLAKEINYDPSHLSRIRSFRRNITHPYEFAESVAAYTVKKYKKQEYTDSLRKLTACADESLESALCRWLCSGKSKKENSIGRFLQSLETFNLDEYIKAIHFDEMKVPTVPFSLPASKHYYGVEQMRRCELDFLKNTALSRSRESVFMCSDMPITAMAKDIEFDKKWMMGIAAMLKRGLTINIIHNLDRPWEEMMLGLEAWIPIYMTGQVNPFYFKKSESDVYHHINYVSGAAAVCGECIGEHFESGRYYLTNNKEELAYYRKKAEQLLEKVYPLMDIYTEEKQPQLQAFLEKEKNEEIYVQAQTQKTFQNIKITVCHGKWVMISKMKHPQIHFVIRHPRLMQAIENFNAEVVETAQSEE